MALGSFQKPSYFLPPGPGRWQKANALGFEMPLLWHFRNAAALALSKCRCFGTLPGKWENSELKSITRFTKTPLSWWLYFLGCPRPLGESSLPNLGYTGGFWWSKTGPWHSHKLKSLASGLWEILPYSTQLLPIVFEIPTTGLTLLRNVSPR